MPQGRCCTTCAKGGMEKMPCCPVGRALVVTLFLIRRVTPESQVSFAGL